MKKNLIRAICMLLLLVVALCGCSDDDEIYRGKGKKPTSSTNTDNSENTQQTVSGNYTKRIAITYDDGPHNVYTVEIADELAKYGYNATFFVVGNRMDGSAGNYDGRKGAKYAAEKGNEIAIHGYSHDMEKLYDTCSDAVFKSELYKTKRAITDLLGSDYKIKLMRPIGGAITSERVKSCEYAVIMWNVDSLDWKYKYEEDGVNTIVNNVMTQVKDGSIVLMHDISSATVEATKIILKQLNEQGYEVVTVSELLGKDLKVGTRYSQAPSK